MEKEVSSEDVFLPPLGSPKFTVKNLEQATLSIQEVLAESLVSSFGTPIINVYDIFENVAQVVNTKSSFICEMLSNIFANPSLFEVAEVSKSARALYGATLAKKYQNRSLQLDSEEDKIQLLSVVWILSSPINILSYLALEAYKISKSLGDEIVSRLIYIIKDVYNINLVIEPSLSQLSMLSALVRGYEIEERNSVLLNFIEYFRAQDKKDSKISKVWLETSEFLNEISNYTVINTLGANYKVGVKHSSLYDDFLESYLELKGNIEAEDELYSELVNILQEDIKKIISAFTYSIKNYKNEDQLFKAISELGYQVSSKIQIMHLCGTVIYEETSVVDKILLSLRHIAAKEELTFEEKLFSCLIPFTLVQKDDAFDLSLNTECYSLYFKFLDEVISHILSCLSFNITKSLESNLIFAFDTPLRSYINFGFYHESDLDMLAPDLNINAKSSYYKGFLVNYSLLRAEESYFKNILSNYGNLTTNP